jgi:cyclopropane fatty-acyl-phospholipid synthase-like methyltransferase
MSLPSPVPVWLALAAGCAYGQQRYQAENLAPFVPSPQIVVDKMLEAAEVKSGETVFDLGCGDGRIVITAAQAFKAKGVCVELASNLVKETKERVKRLGLENRISVVQEHLLNVDLTPADVVTVYLLTSSNELLKPNLEKLKPGARVVSHDFRMRGWKPDRTETVEASNRTHTIYVYRMPPKKE